MINLYLNKKHIISLNESFTYNEILSSIHHHLGLDVLDYYLLHNGKVLKPDIEIKQECIEIVLRTYGGKGGFGSMLRAIGAQIEKTTNREACRDLSGRRLRDINEEKRLKKWITQQTERGKEAAERKQKKLEKLCETPKHKFEDKNYDNERSQLPEIIENAVTQGMKATCSNDTNKRKNNDETKNIKKKPKLWIDDCVDISSDYSDTSDNDSGDQSPNTRSSETNSLSSVEQPLQSKSEEYDINSEKDVEIVKGVTHTKMNNLPEKRKIERIDDCVDISSDYSDTIDSNGGDQTYNTKSSETNSLNNVEHPFQTKSEEYDVINSEKDVKIVKGVMHTKIKNLPEKREIERIDDCVDISSDYSDMSNNESGDKSYNTKSSETNSLNSVEHPSQSKSEEYDINSEKNVEIVKGITLTKINNLPEKEKN